MTDQKKLDSILSSINSEYPRLADQNISVLDQNMTGIYREKEGNPRGPIEFYHREEPAPYSPTPGTHTVGVLNSEDPRIRGNLRNAIFGDMLHAMPDDPKWSSLRSSLMDARDPEQLGIDSRAYEQEKGMYGYDITQPQWEDQSRADAYIRGHFAPDNNDNWGKMYNPAQQKILSKMKSYLSSSSSSATESLHPDFSVDRDTMQSLPNAELSSEVYPYIENSPVARMGFDPAHTTILPDTLGYRSKSNPDMVSVLNGRYIQPDLPSSQLEAPIARTLSDYKRANKDTLISFSHNGNRPREDILSTISHESHHRGTSILDDQHYDEGKARLHDYYNGSPDSKARAIQWFADRNVGTPEAAQKKYKYDDLLAKASATLDARAKPSDPAPPSNKDRILSFLNSF